MKKLKTLLTNDAVRLSCAGILVFLSVYAAFPQSSMLATLCPVILAGLLLPFFFDEARLVVPIAALSAVLLALALTDSVDAYIFYPIVLTLFFILSMQLSRLLRFFQKGREKRLPALCGAVGLVLLAGAWFLIFGNPVSLFQKSRTAEAFYTENYPSETFTLTERYYDPTRGKYVTVFDTGSGADFTAAENEDGYLALIETHAAALQKSDLLALLHEHFSDGNYLITIQPESAEQTLPSQYVYGDQPTEWLKKNEITLEFDSSVAVGTPSAKAEFASRIREYVALLQKEEFPFSSITFRAGEQGEMVYELSATPETEMDELLAPNVKDLRR